jgi:tetratricopeptide (TPR) repeat protein
MYGDGSVPWVPEPAAVVVPEPVAALDMELAALPAEMVAVASAAVAEAGEVVVLDEPERAAFTEVQSLNEAVPAEPAAEPVVPAEPAVPAAPAEPAASSGPGPSADQISRHIARAEALAELGRRQQALDVLNELIVAGAEDPRIWRTLATIYLDVGDGDKALRAADWVITFKPSDEWGYRLRSSALQLLQRPEEAVQAAAEAVKLGPDVWQGHAALALALHGTGDLTAAVAEARKATEMANELAPSLAPEAKQVEDALEAAASAGNAADPVLNEELSLLQGLEATIAGSPEGLDDESLQHVSTLVLRALEFSAGAGWLVSFGGVAIPNINFRFLIPVAVLVVLTAFLFGPARKAGRDIWRYLIEYLWQDPNTRMALILSVAAHVWMIAGSSVGHLQGGSALGIGLLTHLAGRTVLAKKAPELNPVARKSPRVQPPPHTGGFQP